MNKDVELLLKYQEVDGKLKAIDDGLKGTEVVQKNLLAKKFLSSVSGNITDLDAKAKNSSIQYENALKELEELKSQLAEYEASVDTCQTEEELEYFKSKFQKTVDLLVGSEAKIKSIVKELEDLNKKYTQFAVDTKKMKEQYESTLEEYKAVISSKDGERKELLAEMEKIAKGIDESLLKRYNEKRKDKKFPVLVGIDVNQKVCNCPICGNTMYAGAVNDLSSGNVKECDSCRIMLYAK